MGLTIHYSGRLKRAQDLSSLIEEIQDIAEVYKWKYKIHNQEFPNNTFKNETSFDNIYGISFTPTNSETISLAFLSNGTMICPARIPFFADSFDEKKRAWVYTNSVKTQYAGVRVHQLIIHLFKYLNKKYFEDFELIDESDYWETNDENVMKKQFEKYDKLLDNFVLALDVFPIQEKEDMIAYFERLMEHISKLKND